MKAHEGYLSVKTMAGLKRKDISLSRPHADEFRKRSKKEAAQVKLPDIEPSIIEAETDSDPILESDTTEHSGDDDGASWPSEEDEDIIQESGKEEKRTRNPARKDESVKELVDNNTCKTN